MSTHVYSIVVDVSSSNTSLGKNAQGQSVPRPSTNRPFLPNLALWVGWIHDR